jgi:simple sugar transport system permease protein
MSNTSKKTPSLKQRAQLTDSNLLFLIAVCVFVILYLLAIIFLGGSFSRVQGLADLLNNNAALIILACGQIGRAHV